MPRPLVAAATFACLVQALVACGGGGSATSAPSGADAATVAEIEALTVRFADAVDGKDARAFCGLLAPSAIERLGGEKRCLVVWGRDRNPLFATRGTDLSIERITKLGPPTAVARLANGGRLTYLRENGEWFVDLAPETKD